VVRALGSRVGRPVAAVAGAWRRRGVPGNAKEAVVEAEVVADAVLTGRIPFGVVGEAAPDELADAG